MKKIAFLLCSNTVGGHEFQALELVKSTMNYCDVTLFLNIPNHKKLIENTSVKYVSCITPFFKNGNFILQFFHIINKGRSIRNLVKDFDEVVICAGTSEAGICAGYSLFNKKTHLYVPLFVDRKILWGKIGILYNLLLPIFIMPYNDIITINRIQSLFFSKLKKCYIIPNKIETGIMKNKTQVENRKLYVIGRLESQKNILQLIKWLDNPTNPFYDFEVVGSGSEYTKIYEISKNLKNIRVTLKEWLNKEEQEEEFSTNDVLVTNSLYEGEPLIIREANNRGSVVIARDIIGHRGCTYKQNRFTNQKELLDLLNQAFNQKLKRYSNQPANEIKEIREQKIKEVFI